MQFIRNLFRGKNKLDWKPYKHENILSAQIDAIPLPYDVARCIVMEFLYEGVYNDISKYDGAVTHFHNDL